MVFGLPRLLPDRKTNVTRAVESSAIAMRVLVDSIITSNDPEAISRDSKAFALRKCPEMDSLNHRAWCVWCVIAHATGAAGAAARFYRDLE